MTKTMKMESVVKQEVERVFIFFFFSCQHLNPAYNSLNSVKPCFHEFLVRMKRRSSMVPGASSEDGSGLLMPEGSSQSGTPDSWSRRSSLWLEEVIRVPIFQNHL